MAGIDDVPDRLCCPFHGLDAVADVDAAEITVAVVDKRHHSQAANGNGRQAPRRVTWLQPVKQLRRHVWIADTLFWPQVLSAPEQSRLSHVDDGQQADQGQRTVDGKGGA